jgi:hypothetical protein
MSRGLLGSVPSMAEALEPEHVEAYAAGRWQPAFTVPIPAAPAGGSAATGRWVLLTGGPHMPSSSCGKAQGRQARSAGCCCALGCSRLATAGPAHVEQVLPGGLDMRLSAV